VSIVGHVRTFIVRLQEEAGASTGTTRAEPRLRGVVDEVATGLRAMFRNEQELVTALAAAVACRPGPPWTGEQRATYGPSSDSPTTTFEEN
jgi:hypothetical protein